MATEWAAPYPGYWVEIPLPVPRRSAATINLLGVLLAFGRTIYDDHRRLRFRPFIRKLGICDAYPFAEARRRLHAAWLKSGPFSADDCERHT